MARHAYFAFDYADVFKVNQIRNSGAFVAESVAAPLYRWDALRFPAWVEAAAVGAGR